MSNPTHAMWLIRKSRLQKILRVRGMPGAGERCCSSSSGRDSWGGATGLASGRGANPHTAASDLRLRQRPVQTVFPGSEGTEGARYSALPPRENLAFEGPGPAERSGLSAAKFLGSTAGGAMASGDGAHLYSATSR